MQLKILSWNIWIESRFDLVKSFLKDSNADIVGLQEVRADDPTRDTIGYMRSLGYEHVFSPIGKVWGSEVWNDGPAVFSKYPITSTETYTLSETNSRVAVRADIQIAENVLHIFSTHLIHTHQQPSVVQEEQIENLIKVLPSERVIVMGDFNATPASRGVQRMKSVLRDADSTDAPTWSVYPEGCKTCLPQSVDTRLDYIFASADIRTSDYRVGISKGSDHFPVSVIVEL